MAVFFNVSVCETKREIMGVLMFLERVCVCVCSMCVCVGVQCACMRVCVCAPVLYGQSHVQVLG